MCLESPRLAISPAPHLTSYAADETPGRKEENRESEETSLALLLYTDGAESDR